MLVLGRYAADPLFGGPVSVTQGLLGYAAAWLCAAMLLSALPYWLVVLFVPRWPVLDRIEAAVADAEAAGAEEAGGRDGRA